MRAGDGAVTAAGATIFGVSGLVLTADERAFLADASPWGIILFARNIEAPDPLRRLTADLRGAVGRDVPIFIDQEGGRVARMGPPHWRAWPPAFEEVAAAPAGHAGRVMWLRSRIMAAELRAVGIDGNCAPLADVATPGTHPILANRCYGAAPPIVAEAARAVAEGLRAGGVLPVVKHIPGHGRATADSHLELPRVTAPLDALIRTDFEVFAALADLPLAMTAHVTYTAIDPVRPATQSPAAIRLIREAIGFDGLLMTDDISMQALTGSLADRSAASLLAGCDVILHCNGDLAEMAVVANAAGGLSDRAAARAERALNERGKPDPADIATLLAEYESLSGHG